MLFETESAEKTYKENLETNAHNRKENCRLETTVYDTRYEEFNSLLKDVFDLEPKLFDDISQHSENVM